MASWAVNLTIGRLVESCISIYGLGCLFNVLFDENGGGGNLNFYSWRYFSCMAACLPCIPHAHPVNNKTNTQYPTPLDHRNSLLNLKKPSFFRNFISFSFFLFFCILLFRIHYFLSYYSPFLDTFHFLSSTVPKERICSLEFKMRRRHTICLMHNTDTGGNKENPFLFVLRIF